ncbi:MAG: hypothetical protein KGL39_25730 [Patescibacteria group bacterium]|nr:hypothetical protein [Patescibacteria group bacterium]
MAANLTVGWPAQVPSDIAGSATVSRAHSAGKETTTKTFTIPKLTPTGVAGTVTEVNGIITAYTAPT